MTHRLLAHWLHCKWLTGNLLGWVTGYSYMYRLVDLLNAEWQTNRITLDSDSATIINCDRLSDWLIKLWLVTRHLLGWLASRLVDIWRLSDWLSNHSCNKIMLKWLNTDWLNSEWLLFDRLNDLLMADDHQADWFFDWLATDRLPWIWQRKVTKYQYLLIVW